MRQLRETQEEIINNSGGEKTVEGGKTETVESVSECACMHMRYLPFFGCEGDVGESKRQQTTL